MRKLQFILMLIIVFALFGCDQEGSQFGKTNKGVAYENYLDERLELTEQGLIKINETYETSIENVFAGGDLVQKKATVCMAIKNGKEAAKSINLKIE